MNSKKIIKCGVCSFLAALIFFATYYAGLFYTSMVAFSCGTIISILLLVSTTVNTFAEKGILYSSIVLLGCILLQKINMHEIVAQCINFEITSDINMAHRLVVNNCFGFLMYFCSVVIALIFTALISHIKKRTDSF